MPGRASFSMGPRREGIRSEARVRSWSEISWDLLPALEASPGDLEETELPLWLHWFLYGPRLSSAGWGLPVPRPTGPPLRGEPGLTPPSCYPNRASPFWGHLLLDCIAIYLSPDSFSLSQTEFEA